jgi:hypothetical protein
LNNFVIENSIKSTVEKKKENLGTFLLMLENPESKMLS